MSDASDAIQAARALRVMVNGAETQVPAGTTIAELLRTLQVVPEAVAVERNRAIARRATHATTALEDGDQIELVGFVGGG